MKRTLENAYDFTY
jgi:hypothetical protein